MSYEYKALIEQAIIDDDRPLDWEEGFKELDHVYTQAAKADEYEANLKELKKQLKIEIKLARRSGDNAEELAFSEALDMIEKLI